MQTAKLFTKDRSQAVFLPEEMRFSGDEVNIKQVGGMVILLPKDDPWAPMLNSLDQFSGDFMEERVQPRLDTRELL